MSKSDQLPDKVPDTSKHQQYYSEDGLWEKLKSFAKELGSQGVYFTLILYYMLIDEETPTNQKAIIIGALGYLILPLDLIPDITPFIGFGDDLAAITAALKHIWLHVQPRHLQQAEDTTKQWFPQFKAPKVSF